MKRYETKIDEGVVYVETPSDWLAIGSLADIYELAGGETYAISYDDEQIAFAEWLETDEEGTMTIDIRETIDAMTYPEPFVTKLADRSEMPVENDEFPERTAYFVDVMTDIWDSKGNLDSREDNPFQPG